MKRSMLIKLACAAGILAAGAARGQVFNVHNIQHGYSFYGGYNIMAFGQGALSDPGNNIWNGFGDGGTPGSTDSFGNGHPNDGLLPGNPGNPYAWSHAPFFAQGPNLFNPVNFGAANAGNATSAGAHTPITIPSMVYGFDSGNALSGGATLRTNVAEWIYSETAVVNPSSPAAGGTVNPLGLLTLSNVPPGTYDLYLYSANYDGTRGGTFLVSSGTPSNGLFVAMNPYAAAGSGPLTNFVLGTDYVVYNNVTPGADSTIRVSWGAVSNVNSSLTDEGDFNGLQLAPSVPVQAGPLILEQPLGATYSEGANTPLLWVVASGYPAVSYQWYSGSPPGTALVGQTNYTLAFAGALPSQSGNYYVVVTNLNGAVTSSVANLTIAGAPVIVAQSSTNNQILYTENDFVESVTAAGVTPLSYYWRTNGVTAMVTTSSSIRVASLTATNFTGVATFTCLVSNSIGTALSSPMTATIVAPNNPYDAALLALNPVNYWPLTETSGTTAYDFISGNNGSYVGSVVNGTPGPGAGFGTPSYAYTFDGASYVDIPTATAAEPTYVFPYVLPSGTGALNYTGPLTLISWSYGGLSAFQTIAGKGDHAYRIDLDQNGIGHFNDNGPSDAVGGPAIQNGLWHQIVGTYDGAHINLYVDGAVVNAQGDTSTTGDTLDFWIGGAPDYGNGRLFTGSISRVAMFTNALTAAQVQNLFNAGQTPPFIFAQPTNLFYGFVGGTAKFTVGVTGGTPLSYQWSGPGGAIPGATAATLVLTNLNETGIPTNSGPGNYSCAITNAYGSTNSDVTMLLVSDAQPFFVQDLPPISYGIVGSTVSLAVVEGGDEPLTNQWYSGSTALHDGDRGGRITGTTTQTLLIANAETSDEGPYQVLVTNGISPYSAASQVTQLIVESEPLFNTNGAGWTANGGPSINADVLTLTDGVNNETRSFFFDTPMYIGAFRASFTYQANSNATSTTTLADGVTFCLQNSADGPAALGAGGGSLAYAGITNSAAIAIDLYNAAGYEYVTDGNNPSTLGQYVVTAPTVDTRSTHPIDVSLVYNGSSIAISLVDTITSGTFASNITVGALSSVVGGDTAYIGFTGATGGLNSIQTISNFSFISIPVLSASRIGTNVVISWPTGVGGYGLQTTKSLTAPVWNPLPGPYAIVGAGYQVTVPLTSGSQFYRLELQP